MSHRPDNARPRRGFTLVELLIVMGIIALLISLLVPTVTSSLRKARRTRVQMELAGISTALDAYKTDFGDYPRFGFDAADPLNGATTNTNPSVAKFDRGARLLARALLGPAPASMAATTTATDADYLFQDGYGEAGAAVLGFKDKRQVINRNNVVAFAFPGPVRGPYLDAEKFNLRKSAAGDYGPDAVILDSQSSNPILYYVAAPLSPNLALPNALAGTGTMPAPAALFDGYDNRGSTTDDTVPGLSVRKPTSGDTDGRHYLYDLLGDADDNGKIDAGETAALTGPFLLLAGGNEGFTFDPGNSTWSVRNPVANVPLPSVR